ncbi:MAG: HAMP domain-containing histidine kinase [Candidatus Portnoybacteria bacterium]|nr:HAMP domain-containing histidine kinase [Candidatus Portnoybacteria bacterium]
MGLVTIGTMLGTYLVAYFFTDQPEVVALIVIIATGIIFIIGHFIISSFVYLAEANRMKSEFVSITSHQLRTPLSALKWALNLLMDEQWQELDQKQKEYLEIMKINNNRMIRLVNDLLDVSRIEQGRLDLRSGRFSLDDIARNFVAEVMPIAEGRKINLDLEVEENLPDGWADAERVRLVLQNLVDNAIKYSNDDGAVKIRLSRLGNFLKCEVRDNGVGIPEYQRAEVFQKFFRSDNARKYQTDGTGLGLFIAKGIIDASEGEIGFYSEENRGSTFWFTIPIKH